jgi:hypothetical protein
LSSVHIIAASRMSRVSANGVPALSPLRLHAPLQPRARGETLAPTPPDAEKAHLPAAGTRPPLTDQKLADLLSLVNRADNVEVRARRVQGKGDDSVVKLRPVVPDEQREFTPRTAAAAAAAR